MEEIYDLIHKGTLVAHKAPKSGWRIPFQVLVDLNLIKEEEERPMYEVSQIEDRVSYVADEEHYTQVFKLMATFILKAGAHRFFPQKSLAIPNKSSTYTPREPAKPLHNA